MTISRNGASQLLNGQPAKRFNESISQNHREESLQQVISGAYDTSNNLDNASQDQNINPQVLYPGAQILGIHKVVTCLDIPLAPASSFNITHCEPINCKLKPCLELLLAEYNLDYLPKSRKAEVLRMRSEGYGGVYVTYIASNAQPQLWTREVKIPQCQ